MLGNLESITRADDNSKTTALLLRRELRLLNINIEEMRGSLASSGKLRSQHLSSAMDETARAQELAMQPVRTQSTTKYRGAKSKTESYTFDLRKEADVAMHRTQQNNDKAREAANYSDGIQDELQKLLQRKAKWEAMIQQAETVPSK